MTATEPVHVWEFPSGKASEAAYLSTSRRLLALDPRPELLVSRVFGEGPFEGKCWLVAVGPDADRYTVGGGRYDPDPPDELVRSARARYEYMGRRYRDDAPGCVVTIRHAGGEGGPIDEGGRVWTKGRQR